MASEVKAGERKPDPLRILNMADVCRRTGYSRAYIHKMLAEDIKDRRPGRQFPAPLRRVGLRGRARIEWRELRIVEWLESMETVTQ